MRATGHSFPRRSCISRQNTVSLKDVTLIFAQRQTETPVLRVFRGMEARCRQTPRFLSKAFLCGSGGKDRQKEEPQCIESILHAHFIGEK